MNTMTFDPELDTTPQSPVILTDHVRDDKAWRDRCEGIAKRIDRVVVSHDIPLAWIATQAKVSPGGLEKLRTHRVVFSNFSGMSVPARDVIDLDALEKWLEEFDTEEPRGVAALVKTKTLTAIIGMCDQARQYGDIRAITGSVGIGKSKALMAYAWDYRKTGSERGALYVRLGAEDITGPRIVSRIAESLNIHAGNARREQGLLRVITPYFGRGDLLILDECNRPFESKKGDPLALDFVRDLAGDDGTGAGVVLSGNPVFNDSVFSPADPFAGHAALVQRTRHTEFRSSSIADIEAVLRHYGLTDAAIIKRVSRAAAKPGPAAGLRRVKQIFELTVRLKKGGVVTDEDFRVEWERHAKP